MPSFRSLKGEILAITLGLTIFVSVVTIALGVFSTQTAGSDAETATSDVLRSQAEEILVQIATSAANLQDRSFEETRNEAHNLAAFTQNIYDNPTYFSRSYWRFDDRVFLENGRFINRESDVSTIFIPYFLTMDSEEKYITEITAHLDFVAPSVLENNENAVAVYHTDKKGFSRYYPNIVLGRVAPPEHSTLADVVFAGATPENNPEKRIVWSPLYNDPAGRGLMITASAPIYSEGGFEGVIGIDVLLTDIIAEINSYSPIERSYAFLVGTDGQTIAFPDKAYEDILSRSRAEGEIRTDLTTSITPPGFPEILQKMQQRETGFGSIESRGRELFIAYAPLSETGFGMAVVAESEVALKAVTSLHGEIADSIWNTITKVMLPASIFIIIAASILSLFIVSRIAKPIQELTSGAREIGKGNFDYALNVKSKNEIGELASTFTQMSQDLKKSRQELYEYSVGLEKKVAERTQSLTEANAQQESLLHFISHEIKGYLTDGQNAFASIVEGDIETPSAKLREFSQAGLAKMRQGVRTVLEILDASNMKSGAVSYKKIPFDLRAAVEEVFEDMKQKATERGLALDIIIDKKQKYKFSGDKEKISQHVIRNLIDNAIRYTPKGSIHVTLARSDKEIRFSVKDTGVGITVEDKAKLFTEGGHGKDSIKVNVDSTGYGLYIAKQVVEAHGGTIHAESAGAGKGSEFVVELPVN